MLACKFGVEDNFLDNIAKNSTTGHFDIIAIAGGKSKHTWALTKLRNQYWKCTKQTHNQGMP